jgi:hypothetical protein
VAFATAIRTEQRRVLLGLFDSTHLSLCLKIRN